MTSKRAETWWAALILAGLVAVLHHDVVFRGRSLVHSNHSNPFDFRPLPEGYGPNLVPHDEWTKRNLWSYANFRDSGSVWWQWEPSAAFLKRAMQTREWPFWNPYVAAGTPAFANMTPAFFFPPYTLVVALGATALLENAYYLLLLWSAAFFSFLFLRKHELVFLASLVGAILVLVGGSMNQYVGSLAGQTAACLPLILFCTRRFLDHSSRGRAALLAVVYGSVALSSLPPVLVGIFGTSALYTLFALSTGDCAGRPAAVGFRWTLAVFLSIGLVAACYVPALALHTAVPHVAAFYAGAGLETMPARNVYQLLSPTLMGGVQVYLEAPFASGGLGAHVPYVGVLCLMLALLAGRVPNRRARTLLYTCATAAVLILLKLVGVPPVQWIGRLPVFSHLHLAHYLGIPLGFAMAFLASLGFERLLQGTVARLRLIAVIAVALLMVETVWLMAEATSAFGKEPVSFWIRDWKVLAVFAVISSGALAASAFAASTRVHRTAVGTLLGVLMAEALYNNSYPRPTRWDTFDRPVPYVRTLQEHTAMDRVLAFGMPPANSNEAFQVPVLDSLMTFNPPRVYELYRRYLDPAPEVFMRQARHLPPEPVLDRANIRFVGTYSAITEVIGDARQRGYEQFFDNGFTTIFARRTPPRFMFSSDYRVVPTSAALEAIASAAPRQIVLEEEPGVPLAPNQPDDPIVRVLSYRRNSIRLLVETSRPGLVYAADSYFEGWTAFVNGQATPILPANYAFRAIAVPAGSSRIEFRYWPPGLTHGLLISAASAVGLLAWLLLPRVGVS